MKLKASDTWFSKCVRERAGWRCEACGTQYDVNSQGLHCSHLFSRRHRSVRWCGDNAAAHCFSCHQRLGGNPIEFARWIETHLGKRGAELLEEKKNQIVKIPKTEEKDIAAHYRKEFNRMRDLRMEMELGKIPFEQRIEFESYQ